MVAVQPRAGARLRPWAALAAGAQAPAAVLGAMVGLWCATFGWLCWRQHHRWSSFGYDTGLHDQGIWLTAEGIRPFVTIRGMDYWAHHTNLISLVFVPAYRLGAGIGTLTLVHTLWLGAAAVPLWLLARDLTGRPWLSLSVPFAYLLHPALSWIAWWLYHPDSMAILPLCCAWLFARRRRWWPFAGSVAVALACKEDLGFAVLGLGVAVAVLLSRRVGALTAVAGLAWYALCTRVLIPMRGDGGPFYESFFPTLGSSPAEMARNALLNPTRVLRVAGRDKTFTWAVQMLGPLGFVVPLLGGPVLLLGVPQTAVDVLVEVQDGTTIKSQYATLPLVALVLGCAEALQLLRRWPGVQVAAATSLVVCSLLGAHQWGLSPLGREAGRGVWASHERPNIEALRSARRLVPPDAGVSTTYNIVAQFTHRPVAFEYPNPWVSVNYGFDGRRGDDRLVEWLVLDRAALDGPATRLAEALTGPGGGFEVVRDGDGVLLAKRVGPTTVDLP